MFTAIFTATSPSFISVTNKYYTAQSDAIQEHNETRLLQLFGRGGRWKERGGRVGATRYRDDRVPGTGPARKSRVYDVWTVSGGGGSMHPLRY